MLHFRSWLILTSRMATKKSRRSSYPDAGVQRRLIAKVAAVLPSGSRLLFTAPSQSCSWADAMTGRTSISLGLDAYRNALEAKGMSLTGTHRDGGDNHYYFAHKT